MRVSGLASERTNEHSGAVSAASKWMSGASEGATGRVKWASTLHVGFIVQGALLLGFYSHLLKSSA